MPRRSRARRDESLDRLTAKLDAAEASGQCRKLVHPYINSDAPPPVPPGCKTCRLVREWWDAEPQRAIREALRAEREADEQRARRRVDSPEPSSFAELLDDLRKI